MKAMELVRMYGVVAAVVFLPVLVVVCRDSSAHKMGWVEKGLVAVVVTVLMAFVVTVLWVVMSHGGGR